MDEDKKPKFIETLDRLDARLARWQRFLDRAADRSFKFGCQMIAGGIGCLILLILLPILYFVGKLLISFLSG